MVLLRGRVLLVLLLRGSVLFLQLGLRMQLLRDTVGLCVRVVVGLFVFVVLVALVGGVGNHFECK